jgi:hypothetical protein
MAKVVAATAASDTVNLNRGDRWREVATPVPTGQTWQDYGTGALPQITGMDPVVGTWTSTTPAQTWSIAWTISLTAVTAMDVNGTLYLPAASQAALVPGQFFWAANVLYLCVIGGFSTMPFPVEANGNRGAIWVSGASKGGYHFRSIWFHGGTNGTFNTRSPTSASTWTSCRFGHGGAIASIGLLFIQDAGANGQTITDCLFENGITDCLFLTDNDRAVISYCTFISLYGPVSDHIQFSGAVTGSGGGEVHHCYGFIQSGTVSTKGMIVQGNSVTTGGANVHDNFCDGGNYMWGFGGTTFTGFINHTTDRNVHVNGLAGSSTGSFTNGGASTGCSWTFNVSLNNTYDGFNFFGGVAHLGIGVYHNTVYNAGFRAWSTGSATDTVSGTVEDNIFHASGSTHRYRIDNGGITSDYNDIPGEQANYIFWDVTGYPNLANYQAASAQDAHSTKALPTFAAGNQSGQYGQTSNPTTATWASLAPSASSAVRGAGVHVGGVNDSLANPPDIGCYQFAMYVMQGSPGRPFSVLRVKWG